MEDENLSGKSDLKNHENSKSKDPLSQREASDPLNSTEHASSSNLHSVQTTERDNPDGVKKTFKCNFKNCQKTYTLRPSFWRHMKFEHGGRKRLSCYFCHTKLLDERRVLEEHMTGTHLRERPYFCKRRNCRFSTASNRSWRKHMMKKHESEWNRIKEGNKRKKPDEYKCSKCSKIFQKSGSLWAHLKTHIDLDKRRKHSCHICNRTYLVASNLKSHVVQEHALDSDAAFRCPYEGGKHPLYSTKSGLSYHIQNHHDLEKAACKCGKELRNRASLKRHKRLSKFIHGSSKHKFNCTYPGCTNSFTGESMLRHHAKVMHDEQNFSRVCEVCGRRFKFRKQHEDHMVEKHGGASCKSCPKMFTTFKNLVNHRKSVHESKGKFTCGINSCERMFTCDSNLQNHIAKAHKREQKNVCYFCHGHFTSRVSLYGHLLGQHLKENPISDRT